MTSGFQIVRQLSLRRVIVVLLVPTLLVIAGASVWSPLHEWIHHDAGHEDHDCAIKVFYTGSVDSTAAPVIIIAPPEVGVEVEPVALVRVEWVLRRSGILEHAPPAAEVCAVLC